MNKVARGPWSVKYVFTKRRHGLGEDDAEYTLRECATPYGLTHERARQVLDGVWPRLAALGLQDWDELRFIAARDRLAALERVAGVRIPWNALMPDRLHAATPEVVKWEPPPVGRTGGRQPRARALDVDERPALTAAASAPTVALALPKAPAAPRYQTRVRRIGIMQVTLYSRNGKVWTSERPPDFEAATE